MTESYAMRKHVAGIRLAQAKGIALELRKDGRMSAKDSRKLLAAGYIWSPRDDNWIQRTTPLTNAQIQANRRQRLADAARKCGYKSVDQWASDVLAKEK